MTNRVAWYQKFINIINKAKPWQIAVLLLVIGFGVYFTGLNGEFQGDDGDQIVKNEAVHSLSNIGLFFRSSTFWNGETLVGDFYRPMMTTTFSLIYTFFHANPTAFHIVQALLCIASAFILFLFLKSFFKPIIALTLSIIFLVHPINSQIAFSIPSMQEPLMYIFGISALYALSKSRSTKNLLISAGLLFLSLMSKETAIVFVCLAVLYIFLNSKDRVVKFLKIVATPVILFLFLRIASVGFKNIVQSAPIDMLSFGERMIMVPSMIVFYVGKFLFPRDLATCYYWTHKTFTMDGFVIPLIISLIVFAFFIYFGMLIYKKRNKDTFNSYIFFAAWATLGMLPYMQIIALDMTACETWFYCAMVGFLGMITLIISTIFPKIKPQILFIIIIPIIILLGARTSIRGLDFHSQLTLSTRDIQVTDKNYLAMNNLAKYYLDKGKPNKAEWYAQKSIEYFPAVSNYINLGVVRQKQSNFIGAKEAYMKALEFVPLRVTYENIAIINLTIGEPVENIKFLKDALKVFPNDNRLWNYLAIEEAELGNNDQAKNAILNAYRLGKVPSALYTSIINKTDLDIPMPDSKRIIHVRWNNEVSE